MFSNLLACSHELGKPVSDSYIITQQQSACEGHQITDAFLRTTFLCIVQGQRYSKSR